jgi:RimJ/RimL family protein N-acetyltransferase
MQLRRYRDADEVTCASWFPPEGADPFNMDIRWLGTAARKARYEPETHSLYVGCQDGQPVSVLSVSFVPGRDHVVVSLLVAPSVRGQGVGRATIEALRDLLSDIDEFAAYIDPGNDASIGLIESVGLARRPSDVDNRDLFVWRRDGTHTPAPPTGGKPNHA